MPGNFGQRGDQISQRIMNGNGLPQMKQPVSVSYVSQFYNSRIQILRKLVVLLWSCNLIGPFPCGSIVGWPM